MRLFEVLADQASHLEHRYLGLAKDFLELGVGVDIAFVGSVLEFVLFDVEVIFFYPYAVNFKEMGWSGFGAVVAFVGFFLMGFIYVWKRGALEWEK